MPNYNTLASGAAILNLVIAYILIKSPILMAIATGIFGGASKAFLPDSALNSAGETTYNIIHILVFIGFIVLIFMSYPFLTALGVYVLSAVISLVTLIIIDVA